jgi:hypothetical protein
VIEKELFLNELTNRRALCHGPWAIAGDFNMILTAAEKNNSNLNRSVMARFRSFIQRHELNDTYLHGRLYTWSNEREDPTLSRIDKVLASVDWDLAHPDAILQALSSSVSDHAPIHLALSAAIRPKRRFRFELFWLKLEGFEEAVRSAWSVMRRLLIRSGGLMLCSEMPRRASRLGVRGNVGTSNFKLPWPTS